MFDTTRLEKYVYTELMQKENIRKLYVSISIYIYIYMHFGIVHTNNISIICNPEG